MVLKLCQLTPPVPSVRIVRGFVMIERVFIVVDGSNFYHRLREMNLSNLTRFNYQRFGEYLAGGERVLATAKYYVGAVREESGNAKSKELMRAQRILLSNLRKHGWHIGFGHILKTDGMYHEKGVDVLMAVDMLAGAYENLYDTLILVSSDTDLIPALAKVRAMKKKVEYIGFSHKPSHALITHSDIRVLLRKEDLEQFVK